jgi:hypothetical protein
MASIMIVRLWSFVGAKDKRRVEQGRKWEGKNEVEGGQADAGKFTTAMAMCAKPAALLFVVCVQTPTILIS